MLLSAAGISLPGWTCPCGCFNGEAKERLDLCRACALRREVVVPRIEPSPPSLFDATVKMARALLGDCDGFGCALIPTTNVWPDDDHIIHSEGCDTGPWTYCDAHVPEELKNGFTKEESELAAEARAINAEMNRIRMVKRS